MFKTVEIIYKGKVLSEVSVEDKDQEIVRLRSEGLLPDRVIPVEGVELHFKL